MLANKEGTIPKAHPVAENMLAHLPVDNPVAIAYKMPVPNISATIIDVSENATDVIRYFPFSRKRVKIYISQNAF